MLWLTLRQFKSENAETRRRAVERLGKSTDRKAVKALVDALIDRDPQVRQTAATALTQREDADAIEQLGSVLGHPIKDPYMTEWRRAAAAVLAGMAGVPIRTFAKSLHVAHGAGSAQDALDAIPDARAVQLCLAVLQMPEDREFLFWARLAAAEKLSKLGPPGLEPLLIALNDENTQVREQAAEALRQLADPRASAALQRMVNDTNPRVRLLAREAEMETLISELGRRDTAGPNPALKKIRNQGELATRHLLKALDSDDVPTVLDVISLLQDIGATQAIRKLQALSDSRSEEVAQASLTALEVLSKKDATRSAISLLMDLCIRNDILFPQEVLAEAKEKLNEGGDEGSDALAKLILELLDNRSPKITWALALAQDANPTTELLAAVHSVISAEPLEVGTQGRFTPEIIGFGRIGWTDGTHDRITERAQEALRRLKTD
jgi:HEAT repeat protein